MRAEYVLCVPADLKPNPGEDWQNFVTRRGCLLERGNVESNKAWRQIIPYMVFYDWKSNMVLAYQRPSEQTETRLAGAWTIGVGGHIKDSDRSISSSMDREALEELTVLPRRKWFLDEIRMDATPVDRVHVGILVLVSHWYGKISPTPEVPNPSWVSFAEAGKLNLETWARFALNRVSDFITTWK